MIIGRHSKRDCKKCEHYQLRDSGWLAPRINYTCTVSEVEGRLCPYDVAPKSIYVFSVDYQCDNVIEVEGDSYDEAYVIAYKIAEDKSPKNCVGIDVELQEVIEDEDSN